MKNLCLILGLMVIIGCQTLPQDKAKNTLERGLGSDWKCAYLEQNRFTKNWIKGVVCAYTGWTLEPEPVREKVENPPKE